jgi:hypothetical protein
VFRLFLLLLSLLLLLCVFFLFQVVFARSMSHRPGLSITHLLSHIHPLAPRKELKVSL